MPLPPTWKHLLAAEFQPQFSRRHLGSLFFSFPLVATQPEKETPTCETVSAMIPTSANYESSQTMACTRVTQPNMPDISSRPARPYVDTLPWAFTHIDV
jgi:hypothetical protein